MYLDYNSKYIWVKSRWPIGARLRGLEPLTFHVTGGRSNQLSYSPKLQEFYQNFCYTAITNSNSHKDC